MLTLLSRPDRTTEELLYALAGFDCLVLNANEMYKGNVQGVKAESFTATLIHELNHYIVWGCLGQEDGLWSYDADSEYPLFSGEAYTLGPFFLRYIERETAGQSRLWTEFFARQTPLGSSDAADPDEYLAQRTPGGSIEARELDEYLRETTGESQDAWMARFMAAILYRYAQAQGKGFTGAWMFPLDYSDAGDVSEWAGEAMHWMVMHGVITGLDDGTLAPRAEATRAQIATMFMRFCEELEKETV